MNAEDRILFLRYALPCASTLVKRGSTTQENVDRMTGMVSEGIAPEDGAEKIFKVAIAMCNSIARRMGKDTIDAEVIRRYFLMEHSEVVDERYGLMGDFDPVACKTYPGKVISTDGGFAVVETRLGSMRYKTVLARDTKEGDLVSVHYDFVIEKIDAQTAEEMRHASHEKRD
jgi:hydrogenase maturation factor